MKKVLKLLYVLIASLSINACVSTQWKATNGKEIADAHKRFKIKAPSGWMQLAANSDSIVISRDGLSLQSIKVGAIRENDLQAIMRKIARDKNKSLKLASLLPSELAGIVVSIFKNRKQTSNIKVLVNEPATIGTNITGFRLSMVYKTDSGLQVKREVYGYAKESTLVFIMYQAPKIHYYARDLSTFRRIIASFRRL